MGKRAKPTTIISASLGIAAYLLERGLDMAGVTISLGWAVVLWIISGILILFAVAVGFKAYLWPILRTIRIVRWGGEMPVHSGDSDLTQKYANWMTESMNRDKYDFLSCIKVSGPKIIWEHLVHTDSYIELRFDVWSSSVYLLDIGGNVEGHVKYQGEELERLPEVIQGVKKLKRSNRGELRLRQWFSQSMMNRIALDGSKDVTFGFNHVNILVEGKAPDGTEGSTCRLPLPDGVTRRMPTRMELEH